MFLFDFFRRQGTASYHSNEVGKAVAHVRGLKGKRIARGEHGVGFSVRPRRLAECLIEACNGMAAVYERLSSVVYAGEAAEVRGSQREQGVHEIFMLFGELRDVMDPNVVIVDGQMWVRDGEEVMEESHVQY